jgi:large subunit ribosomal protein L3
MSIGILGKKIGMTRVYDDKGAAVAVTVIAAEPNVVTLVRTLEKDGYRAVQLAFDETTEKRSTKPMNGHFKKAGVAPRKRLQEFPLAGDEQLAVGAAVDVTQFTPGQFVDIIGVTKGKGFQGVVRRFRFAGQPASHGSMMHRRIGAIGQRTTPGRVYKNFRMPGHMGCAWCRCARTIMCS